MEYYYNNTKAEIIDVEPIYKRTEIKKVHIPQSGVVDINGKVFKAKQSFINELSAEIGLGENAITQLRRNLNNNEINSILNKSFSKYFSRNPALTRNVIGERESSNLFRLSKGEIIPFSTIFDAVDKIKSKFNDIMLEYTNYQLRIILVGKNINISDFKGEDFQSNLGMQYSYGKVLNHVKIMERISCTNQITSNILRHPENKLAAINSPIGLIKSVSAINHEILEKEYISMVKRVKGIKASVKEYEYIFRILSRFISKDNNYLYNKLLQKETYDLYKSTDVNFDNADELPKEKQFTPIKYWDLINGMTDFASHNYYELINEERDELKQKAFVLLKRIPDMLKYSLN